MKHLEEYNKHLASLEEFKRGCMDSIVSMFKTVQMGSLHVGNMVYFYVKYNGRDVPAYCYESDYKKGKGFLPIYDEENNGEFGFSDFADCCRIFDVIEEKIMNKQ